VRRIERHCKISSIECCEFNWSHHILSILHEIRHCKIANVLRDDNCSRSNRGFSEFVIRFIEKFIVSLWPKLDIRSISRIETATLGWSLLSEKTASVLRLDGVWLPQLSWVVTNSFLPTCKRKGWCCHDTGLFSFSTSLFVIRRFSCGSLPVSVGHNLRVTPTSHFEAKNVNFGQKSLDSLKVEKSGLTSKSLIDHNPTVFRAACFLGYEE
jgi:hypothetical protein